MCRLFVLSYCCLKRVQYPFVVFQLISKLTGIKKSTNILFTVSFECQKSKILNIKLFNCVPGLLLFDTHPVSYCCVPAHFKTNRYNVF